MKHQWVIVHLDRVYDQRADFPGVMVERVVGPFPTPSTAVEVAKTYGGPSDGWHVRMLREPE